MTESATGEVRYLLSDGLGSVRQATDETGAIVTYYEFDPYGNPVDNSGGEPYGYTGEWYEGYIHLLHLRARWYNAETGTFLSRDAVESEPAYLYVRGNPVNYVDPYGYLGCGGSLPTTFPLHDSCPLVPGSIPSSDVIKNTGAGVFIVGLGVLLYTGVIETIDAVDEMVDIANEAWESWQEPEPENEPTPPPFPWSGPRPQPPNPCTPTPTPNPIVRVRHYRRTIEKVMSTNPLVLKYGSSGPATWVEYPITTPYEPAAIQKTSASFMRPLNGQGGFVEFNVDLNKWSALRKSRVG